jgi:hypothetical protein
MGREQRELVLGHSEWSDLPPLIGCSWSRKSPAVLHSRASSISELDQDLRAATLASLRLICRIASAFLADKIVGHFDQVQFQSGQVLR